MSARRRQNIRTQTDQELAELEAAEEQGSPQVVSIREEHEDEPTREESRSHLVRHRAARKERVEEQFESVYKRDTYYIDRTYAPRLKKMIEKTNLSKTALLNEGLAYLFEKYGID